MTKKVKGSAKLGRWLANANIERVESIGIGKRKDVAFVLKVKSTGHVFLLVPTRHNASYRGEYRTLSDARKAGEECWTLDARVFDPARARHDISRVVHFLVDTDEAWISQASDWRDPNRRYRSVKPSGLTIYKMPVSFMTYMPSTEPLKLASK